MNPTPYNFKFPNADLIESSSNWLKLSKMTRAEVQAVVDEWAAINASNIQIETSNRTLFNSCIEDVKTFAKQMGIQCMDHSGRKEKPSKWFAAISEELRQKLIPRSRPSCPSRGGYGQTTLTLGGISITVKATGLMELYDELQYELNKKQKSSDAHDAELIASVKYACSHNIDIVGKTSKEIIDLMLESASLEFMEKNYPIGTTISIDDNYCDCATYTFGNNRCSCGNRRINAYVEGSLATELILTVEPY